MKAKSTSAKSATATTLSEGETVNPVTPTPVTVELPLGAPATDMEGAQRNAAVAFLVSLYGLPSNSSLLKALDAAKRVSIARARRGDVLSRLPVIREAVKGGKASLSKGECTDRNGMTRDTSSLSADDVKAFNAITTIVNAAETLGL